MTKQFFSTHKIQIIIMKKTNKQTNTQTKTIYKRKPKSFEIA